MTNLIQSVKNELRANIDPVFKAGAQRFFKEEVKVIGVRSPLISQIASKYYRDVKELPKQEFFNLCKELWKNNFIDEAFVAINWLNRSTKKFNQSDFDLFESWIGQYVTNWATCDTFCTHAVGDLVYRYPELFDRLKTWAKSPNRWSRRAAAVTLIRPILNSRLSPLARRSFSEGGLAHSSLLNQVFEISDSLMLDSDDLVQKGYGWLLKVTSQVYPKDVYKYVMRNKEKMPRTALRYAIEKMSLAEKEILMRKSHTIGD